MLISKRVLTIHLKGANGYGKIDEPEIKIDLHHG